jgi:hypothetical protein
MFCSFFDFGGNIIAQIIVNVQYFGILWRIRGFILAD